MGYGWGFLQFPLDFHTHLRCDGLRRRVSNGESGRTSTRGHDSWLPHSVPSPLPRLRRGVQPKTWGGSRCDGKLQAGWAYS